MGVTCSELNRRALKSVSFDVNLMKDGSCTVDPSTLRHSDFLGLYHYALEDPKTPEISCLTNGPNAI